VLGIVEAGRGNYVAADAMLAESHTLARTAEPIFGPLMNYARGTWAYGRGDLSLAKQYMEQALVAGRALERPLIVCWCLDWLGLLAIDQGDYAKAISAFREGLAVSSATELGSLNIATQPLARGYLDEFTALLALLTRQPERAVRLLGATAASEELHGEKYALPERTIVALGRKAERCALICPPPKLRPPSTPPRRGRS
jgi:hypothetical protein